MHEAEARLSFRRSKRLRARCDCPEVVATFLNQCSGVVIVLPFLMHAADVEFEPLWSHVRRFVRCFQRSRIQRHARIRVVLSSLKANPAKVGPTVIDAGPRWPNLAEFGREQAELGRRQPALTTFRLMIGRLRGQSWPSLVEVDPFGAMLVQSRSEAQIGPNLADIGFNVWSNMVGDSGEQLKAAQSWSSWGPTSGPVFADSGHT